MTPAWARWVGPEEWARPSSHLSAWPGALCSVADWGGGSPEACAHGGGETCPETDVRPPGLRGHGSDQQPTAARCRSWWPGPPLAPLLQPALSAPPRTPQHNRSCTWKHRQAYSARPPPRQAGTRSRPCSDAGAAAGTRLSHMMSTKNSQGFPMAFWKDWRLPVSSGGTAASSRTGGPPGGPPTTEYAFVRGCSGGSPGAAEAWLCGLLPRLSWLTGRSRHPLPPTPLGAVWSDSLPLPPAPAPRCSFSRPRARRLLPPALRVDPLLLLPGVEERRGLVSAWPCLFQNH